MARVTPAEYAEKWGRRMKGATADIARGVGKVKEAPGIAAARQVDAMRANVNAAIDDGTWGAQVAAVTLPEWQKSMTEKGVGRVAAGVDQAMPNQTQMAERLLAAVDASVAVVDRLPSGTLEDSVNRASTFIREMSARKLRRPKAR
jgi:hypothetical protein